MSSSAAMPSSSRSSSDEIIMRHLTSLITSSYRSTGLLSRLNTLKDLLHSLTAESDALQSEFVRIDTTFRDGLDALEQDFRALVAAMDKHTHAFSQKRQLLRKQLDHNTHLFTAFRLVSVTGAFTASDAAGQKACEFFSHFSSAPGGGHAPPHAAAGLSQRQVMLEREASQLKEEAKPTLDQQRADTLNDCESATNVIYESLVSYRHRFQSICTDVDAQLESFTEYRDSQFAALSERRSGLQRDRTEGRATIRRKRTAALKRTEECLRDTAEIVAELPEVHERLHELIPQLCIFWKELQQAR